ncbi:hypothetical protein NicSoilB11_17710 [Arthrobacter sp. NicSoilB11]|nr:hypothetical protein NicSoilB11_17710 [Arthrobacter sp. NicSoilB11]
MPSLYREQEEPHGSASAMKLRFLGRGRRSVGVPRRFQLLSCQRPTVDSWQGDTWAVARILCDGGAETLAMDIKSWEIWK